MTQTLNTIGCTFGGFAFFILLRAMLSGHPMAAKHYNACWAAAWAAFSVEAFLLKSFLAADIQTAMCGYHLWQWWKSGGGDDTKRRWRTVTSAFIGTRRTAPSAA